MSDSNNGQIPAEETASSMPDENKSAEDTQPTLPDGVSERTASEFEKLKASNKALAEENASLRSQPKSSVLDEIRPSIGLVESQANNYAPAVAQDFVDDGGYVDTALLNATLTEAKRQAEEARRISAQNQAEIQKFQETEQVRKAHQAFPQLDPNNVDSFDPKFYNLVKNELIGQLMSGQQDVVEAAKKVTEYYQAPSNQAKVEKQQQTISNREQASATTGASQGQTSTPERDALIAGTMRGDNEAIGKRLQASGY